MQGQTFMCRNSHKNVDSPLRFYPKEYFFSSAHSWIKLRRAENCCLRTIPTETYPTTRSAAHTDGVILYKCVYVLHWAPGGKPSRALCLTCGLGSAHSIVQPRTRVNVISSISRMPTKFTESMMWAGNALSLGLATCYLAPLQMERTSTDRWK